MPGSNASSMPHHNDYFLGRPTSPRKELSTTAKTAIPGYAGHKPTNMKDKSSPPPSEAGDARSETSSMAGMNNTGQRFVSNKGARAPPGYSGHIPGMVSNGVHGRSFRAANREAIANYRAPAAPEVTLEPHQFHGRVHIPGYSGHMPGREADNLFGRSPVKAAKEGWLVETRKHEKGGGLVKYEED
mmetsp:Transcript_45370/g.97271  ORF Transcript_45370/g.97271 Transcript_45370/m.97271 type:complete len:186 (-) Transcript_45370:87-644(-)|eukprot:CAMPEP_0206460808 /NCGR_PEP_ID=MMETSP0324_2-20121206/24959_1 /ASSEMBLY_ACC=CAM_ASM_000836 /TAXON_ID=2866 /ORGANISM="Crypthecodinium cohnii, Strain Seligo" /LENGTH=185 /DNA_ID=CAMNT_0053932555 /DNA_START=184 /DNA_END=741 /DNA_ORIENTATION=+